MVVLSVSVLVFIFFFFQAEDGIRDLTVTGVQTCALPISSSIPTTGSRPSRSAAGPSWSGVTRARVPAGRRERRDPVDARQPLRRPRSRSEERRVGEECRSRWSPDHLKKKNKIYSCLVDLC